MLPLTLRPEAEADLADSYRFYQDCRDGLGTDFLLCVEECLQRIQRHSAQFPRVYHHVQRALMHRFPYAVFFVVMAQGIVVLAVMHASRHPGGWQSRS